MFPRKISFILTLAILQASCSGSVTMTFTSNSRTPTEIPTITPETLPKATPLPTLTPSPSATSLPTVTPSPSATLIPTETPPYPFRDDFEGSIKPGWLWVREDTTQWSLTEAPGYLRIYLSYGNIGPDSPNNLLIRRAPVDNFEISTRLRFEPTSNYQFAGLLIYEEDGMAIQFGRAFAPHIVRNGIYFDYIKNNEFIGPNFATIVETKSLAYLRLRRESNIYKGYFSVDGVDWILIGQHTSNINPKYVGLVAAQAFYADEIADFDYFTLDELP